MASDLEELIESLDEDAIQNPLVAIFQPDSKLIVPLQIKKIAECIVPPEASGMEKYTAIFDWMVQNIEYDEKLRDKVHKIQPWHDDFPNIINILKKGKGICQDMAQLYIVMAKSIGLEARYARIIVDCEGERVRHACAYIGDIDDDENRPCYVDPAYQTFDVRHLHAKIKSDYATDQQIMECMLMKRHHALRQACKAKDYRALIEQGDVLLYFNPQDAPIIKQNMAAAFHNIANDLEIAGRAETAAKARQMGEEYNSNNDDNEED